MSGMGGGGGGMGRDRMDMMGAGRDRMDMMGGSRDRMMDMSYPRPGNDNMMGQRSMSMNNGSYGGGHGMDNNGYNRSMSFNGEFIHFLREGNFFINQYYKVIGCLFV